MYKIINANGVEFTDPEGSFTLSKTDKVNEYEGEDGRKTIEIIRQNQISASVSYKGLTVEQLKTMSEALSTVTTFLLYDALTGKQKQVIAKVSSVKVTKVYHKGDLSVWSLTFDIDEL